MEIKKFKNGNLHLKLDANSKKLKEMELLEHICNECDLLPLKDYFTLGNDCMGRDYMYNGGEYYYTITSYDFNKLKENKSIILTPIKDLEHIEFLLED